MSHCLAKLHSDRWILFEIHNLSLVDDDDDDYETSTRAIESSAKMCADVNVVQLARLKDLVRYIFSFSCLSQKHCPSNSKVAQLARTIIVICAHTYVYFFYCLFATTPLLCDLTTQIPSMHSIQLSKLINISLRVLSLLLACLFEVFASIHATIIILWSPKSCLSLARQ